MILLQKDVPEFLRHLHLNKEYTNLFKEYGYELDSDVDNLLNLTERDLVHMGVTKRGMPACMMNSLISKLKMVILVALCCLNYFFL